MHWTLAPLLDGGFVALVMIVTFMTQVKGLQTPASVADFQHAKNEFHIVKCWSA